MNIFKTPETKEKRKKVMLIHGIILLTGVTLNIISKLYLSLEVSGIAYVAGSFSLLMIGISIFGSDKIISRYFGE